MQRFAAAFCCVVLSLNALVNAKPQGCLPGAYDPDYKPKCYTRVELAFVIDSSHSIHAHNFEQCLTFVKNIVSQFEILETLTRVGIVSYSNNARVQLMFKDATDDKKVLSAIDAIPHHNSGTKTGNAIVTAGNALFSQSRPDVRKVLVVLTDGQSSDDSETPANALKKAGVEIFAIGVGNFYRKSELIGMATDSGHVFTSSFDGLKALEKPIRDRVCEPPSIVYKCQCECCGDVYTCTQNDVKQGFPACKRSCDC